MLSTERPRLWNWVSWCAAAEPEAIDLQAVYDVLMGADISGDIWWQLSPSDGPLVLEDASCLVQIAQVYIDL